MTEPRFAIDGDVALVTGGSSGFGEAIPERFWAAGVDMVGAIAHLLASRGASFVTGETLTAGGAPEPISFPEAHT
ncbi:MAG: NAD(P)-dependent dehydrogenase (short-subunit alcohol dehydrogenase family) [Halobacteriales archaeon]